MLKLSNTRGIPCLEVQNIDVRTANVVFQFAEHPYFRQNFQGLFLVRNTKTFAAPTSALPVQFETIGVANSQVNVVDVDGSQILSTYLTGKGIYLFFYDRPTNTLQLMSRDS